MILMSEFFFKFLSFILQAITNATAIQSDLLNQISNMSTNSTAEIAKIEAQALKCVAANLSNATTNSADLNNQITACLTSV